MYIVSIYNVCILFSSIHLLSLIMMRDDIHNNNKNELEQKQKRDASCFNFKYCIINIYN